MAAVASVTFTSAGTATLGAAAFTLAGFQAAGEEAGTTTTASEQQSLSGDYEIAEESANIELTKAAGPTAEEKEAEDKLNEELEDNARLVKEKEEAEKNERTTAPLDEEALKRALDNVNSASGGGSGYMSAVLAGDPVETETVSPQAAPAQQGTTVATGTLPSSDLGFTTDVNGNTAASLAKAAVASPAPALMGAAPAADNEQTSLNLEDTAETTSTVQTDTLPTAQPAYNGYYGGIYTGPSIRPMAKSAASTPLLGAVEEEPATTAEPDPTPGYANVITTTFENANQASIGRVTLRNTFTSAAGGTVPVGGITSLKGENGADLGVKMNGTAGSDATFLSPNADVQNNPWTMVMTFSGAEVVQSMTGITLSVGLFNADGNWLPRTVSMNGDVTFTATLAAADVEGGDSFTFTGSLFNGEEGPHHGQGADKFIVNLTGEALNMRAVPNATITLTLSSTLDHSCYVGLQDIKYNVTTVPYTEHDLFWKGGAGDWNKNPETKNWNIVSGDGSYQAVAFEDGSNIYFYQPGVSSLNITEQALEAGNVFVDHGVHVQLSAVTGARLTAKNVNVLGDITVTDVAIVADTLNIEEGSTVTANTTGVGGREGYLTPNLFGDGTFVKDGAGTLWLAGDNTKFEGNFVIKGGKLAVYQSETGALGLGVNPDVTLAGEGAELAGNINATGRDIRITSTADGTVSANISAPEDATLTFDTHEGSTLTASGTLAGNIYKDGAGTLKITGDNSGATGEFFIYQGRVEATDSTKSLGSGTVHVDSNATLALTDTNGDYSITGLDLDYGSTIEIARMADQASDTMPLNLDYMFLHSNAYLDFSNVTLTAPESGSKSYYLAHYSAAETTEAGSVLSIENMVGLVQFINLTGLENSNLRADQIVSLWVDPLTQNVRVQVDSPHTGSYWKIDNGNWNTTEQNWSTNFGLTDSTRFRNSTKDAPFSAYFMQEGIHGVTLNELVYDPQSGKDLAICTVRDLVIGAGDYTFNSSAKYGHTINIDRNRASQIIVASGAHAHFDNVYLETAEGSYFHVNKDASYDSVNSPFGVYSMNNEGTVNILAEPYFENILGHVANTGDFKAVWYDTQLSAVMVGEIVNLNNMTLGASYFMPNSFYGNGMINNDGKLTIDANCPEVEWDPERFDPDMYEEEQFIPTQEVVSFVPVHGFGDMITIGNHTVRFSSQLGDEFMTPPSAATVSQDSLNLGAANNIFEEAVELTSYTTVKSGSEATFYGGNTIDEEAGAGSFGGLTLEAGTADDKTKMTLGGYYHGEYYIVGYDEEWHPIYQLHEEQHDSTYSAGPVTAGEHTVFTVENGANATIESYNAEAEERRGTIVVGAATSQVTKQTPLAYSDATLTVDGKTNVKELTVHKGTGDKDQVSVDLRGAANVGHLTQDGGTVHFHENSFLDTGDVSGGVMCIKPDHVLTLGHVITETGNYTVVNNDGVGIAGYIDASNLKLVTDTTHSSYREVKYEGETTRFQSGFISSGRQYVQVFDVKGGTLTGNDTIIYHKDAAGVMHLISGSDPTVTELGPYAEGGGGFAGYGYLEIADTQYLTYYVRDNYVSGNQDGRTDEHETVVKPRPANQVKLSEIITASIVDEKVGPLLQSVVFDQTDYNKNTVVGDANFNGTVTVDVSTKADLFSVTDGTLAALNINDPVNPETEVVVLADQDYQGVQGTLKIAGTDVYQIDNRGDLGKGVSLLKDDTDGVAHWTGTVRLTGTAEDVYMPDLSVNEGEAASTIEFNQWTGTFKEGAQTSNGKIVLVGDDFLSTQSAAITFAETEHDTTTDLTWTNTVTGDRASVTHLNDGDLNLTMTGDTSAWTGHFLQGADGTNVNLTFNLDDSARTATREQNTEIWSASGDMTVTYGGDLEKVGANVHVYDDSAKLTLVYTADELAVTGIIAQQNGQGDLHLVVGDGTNPSVTTFSGLFAETEGADMTVKKDSKAVIATDTPLLWVRGEEGSTVQVTTDETLTLTSQDPENSYSRFYNLDNQGTIKMEGNGGDIKLVDLNGNKTYNLGDLRIVNGPGTAAIETSSVDGKATTVNITNLSSPATDQTLKLMNDNGQGTVAYNLGGDTSFAGGTIQFGSNEDSGSANVVLQSNDVAANAVLESTGTSKDDANVVVDTSNAKVVGINSTDDSTVGGSVYGTEGSSNRELTITGDGTYSYNGALGENLDIAYTGDGKQTFEGGADNFNGDVTVKSGSSESGILALQNASEVQITDLLIGANDTLEVKNGETNGVAYVSGTLTAEGGPTTEGSGSASKLNGDLTLNNGATYDVSAAGGTGGLDLGGELTISTGATLSSGDIDLIYQMEIGEKYDLAFDVTKFNNTTTPSGFNEDGTTFGSPIDASELFGGDQFWKGEYYVCFSGAGLNGGNGSNVGTVYLYKATPEPTTGTLSLLALAALAARRRRKG